MSQIARTIEQSIEAVNRVHDRLGSKAFAQAAGVPYTTFREALRRGFTGRPVDTLIKLASAAEQIETAQADEAA